MQQDFYAFGKLKDTACIGENGEVKTIEGPPSTSSGKVIFNGNPYDISYSFFTFRDSLIVNYREKLEAFGVHESDERLTVRGWGFEQIKESSISSLHH